MGLLFLPFLMGAIVGAFVASNSGHGPDMFVWGFWWGLTAQSIAVALFIIYYVAKKAWDRSKDARRAEENAREYRRNEREAAAGMAIRQARVAVQAFQCMPQDLNDARGWISEAQRFRIDGAYSPFWSAVENGFSCLAAFRDRITTIESSARVHAEQISRFAANGGDPTGISKFPVYLSSAEVKSAAERPLRELEAKVYDAQKDAVFAQIWEQRRTTAAVIKGFQNLEQAVYHMGSAISSSIQSFSTSLSESNNTIKSTLQNMTDTLVAANSEQVQEMRSLNLTTRRIHGEVLEAGR